MYFVQADILDYLRLERDLKPVLKKQSTEACLFGLTIIFLLLRTLLGVWNTLWVCGTLLGVWNTFWVCGTVGVKWTKHCNDMLKLNSSLIFKGGV